MNSGVRLDLYDNGWYDPGRSFFIRVMWLFIGLPLFRSPLLPSSHLRVILLRLFGARVGTGVVIHSEAVVKYPWHLQVGDHCWIGERVWIDCLTTVSLGSNVCVSQGVYICTGNHDWSDRSFGLRIQPVRIGAGCWVGAQSTLLPGSTLEIGAVLTAGSIFSGKIPSFNIFGGNPARYVKTRVLREADEPQPGRETVAQ